MSEARVRERAACQATGRRGCRFLFVERSEAAPVLDPDVVEFIHGGVAVGVATRDDDLRPEFARGWGPEVSADGRSLRLCVSAPEGSRMRANLVGERGGRGRVQSADDRAGGAGERRRYAGG